PFGLQLRERDQLDDLVGALPARRLHHHLVSHGLVEECPTDGRGEGDPSVGRVYLFGEDDLVDGRLAVVVLDRHATPVRDHVARDGGDVVHRELAHPALELRDARAHEVLPVLGGFVLGVLGQIAVRPSRLELLRQLERELVLQVGQLPLEPGEDGKLHAASAQVAGSASTRRAISLAWRPSKRPANRSRSAPMIAPMDRPTGVDATSRMTCSSSPAPSWGGTYASSISRSARFCATISLRPALAAKASASSRCRISRRTSSRRSASPSSAPRRSTRRFLIAVRSPRST